MSPYIIGHVYITEIFPTLRSEHFVQSCGASGECLVELSRRAGAAFLPVEDVSNAIARKLDQHVVQADQESNRVKTRFLRFIFEPNSNVKKPVEKGVCFIDSAGHESALARLEIIEGKGRGKSFDLASGVYNIGRADDQEIKLAFGDDSISRKTHAVIFHYGKRSSYVIRDGIKPNPVTLNGRLLQGDQNINDGDLIRIGETTILFTEQSKRRRPRK